MTIQPNLDCFCMFFLEKLFALFSDMIFVSQSVFFMTFETKCMAVLSHVFILQQAKFFSAQGQVVVLKVVVYLSLLDYLNVIKQCERR